MSFSTSVHGSDLCLHNGIVGLPTGRVLDQDLECDQTFPAKIEDSQGCIRLDN